MKSVAFIVIVIIASSMTDCQAFSSSFSGPSTSPLKTRLSRRRLWSSSHHPAAPPPSDDLEGARGDDDDSGRGGGSRRGMMMRSMALLGSSMLVGVVAPPTTRAAAGSIADAGADPATRFCGRFSDPINHPGGTRTISLIDDGANVVGDYRLARVDGGGGRGEPREYVLPAVVIGDRAIIIDFSPKGGPRDFTGVLDPKDGSIRFLRDGNRWPRLE